MDETRGLSTMRLYAMVRNKTNLLSKRVPLETCTGQSVHRGLAKYHCKGNRSIGRKPMVHWLKTAIDCAVYCIRMWVFPHVP